MKLYPLKFESVPIAKEWGGTAFVGILGKKFIVRDEDGNEDFLPSDTVLGESYEAADLGEGYESVVSNGFLAGNTLGEITETYMEDLIGDNPGSYFGTQFPIAAKLADIKGGTPVHVHPDDRIAFDRFDALGKKELWYIMAADRNAAIYVGLSREISAEELFDRCMKGTIKEVMHRITPRRGDMVVIPPGTLHCAENGILAAVVEESSLLHFDLCGDGLTAEERLQDIGEAMDFIDLKPAAPLYYDRHSTGTITDSDQFTVNKIELDGKAAHIDAEETDSALLYFCVEGAAVIQCDPEKDPAKYALSRGEALIIPACASKVTVIPDTGGCTLLEAFLRERKEHDSYVDD